jgi:hypothetical protein
MSEQEESMTTCDETVTTETEKDQENTPENVSVCIMFRTVKILSRTTRMLQVLINSDQQ